MPPKKLKIKKPTLKGAARIEAAHPEARDFVDRMLLSEETPYTIAARLKEDWSEFQAVTNRTIERNIEAYAKTEQFQKRKTKLEVEEAKAESKRFDTHVDVLEEMQWLSQVQKDRVEKLVKREDPSPLPLEMLSKEILNYKQVLSETGRMQLELGVIQRAPKKVSGMVTSPDGRPTRFSWTEEQDSLLEVIKDASA